jgi:hypothetical protein
MKTDAQKHEQMIRDFYVTMAHYKLPLEVRKVALASALSHWRKAARCYHAIANSLQWRKP